MKIAIDARILFTSTGRYVAGLLRHLQELDTQNEYLVLLLAKDFDRWEPVAPNFRKVVADFPIYSVGEQLGFTKLLYDLAPDLVHFTMPQHPLLYLKRRVVTVHDLTLFDFVNKRTGTPLQEMFTNYIKPAAFKLVLQSAVRRSRAIIVPTKFMREQLTRRFGVPGGRVYVTYEAGDPVSDTSREIDVGQGKDFVMYVGNAYPYKNLWRLIEGHQALDRPGVKLVLVGKKDYFYEQLERRVRVAGYQNVIFAGFVPDDQLAWLYQHAKLYVFASLSEGFGLPPLEAMQFSLPVLSSKASCLPEVYGDGAEYFDPESTDDLAKRLGELLDDPKRRKELGKAGHERVQQYSWKRMAEQTLDIYKRAGR